MCNVEEKENGWCITYHPSDWSTREDKIPSEWFLSSTLPLSNHISYMCLEAQTISKHDIQWLPLETNFTLYLRLILSHEIYTQYEINLSWRRTDIQNDLVSCTSYTYQTRSWEVCYAICGQTRYKLDESWSVTFDLAIQSCMPISFIWCACNHCSTKKKILWRRL